MLSTIVNESCLIKCHGRQRGWSLDESRKKLGSTNRQIQLMSLITVVIVFISEWMASHQPFHVLRTGLDQGKNLLRRYRAVARSFRPL